MFARVQLQRRNSGRPPRARYGSRDAMSNALADLPCEQLTGFLAAIHAEPDADEPRLVFADWLEDHGDPRSELIRIQCEMARAPFGSLLYLTLEDREREWLDRYDEVWPGELGNGEIFWERGLP